MRWIIVLMFVGTGFLTAEPFVYGGAGSSDQQIKRNKTAIYKLRQETARLREEIEGLRSIIEGLNQTVGRLQQKNSEGNRRALGEIAKLLDKINQEYVSRAELKKLLGKKTVATTAGSSASRSKKTSPKPGTASSSSLNRASSSALYSRGVRLVGKKRYNEAKKRFDILAKRGYKKATTHFYLGEIAYRTGRYSDAIEEYKRSAELNEDAGYMDKLLLHTGLSMEKNGDREQAKRFFQAIVDGYPGTDSAKVAQKHLR